MELVLHLGAHRTGSTAIAEAFRLSGDAVKDMGVTLRRPNRLRKIPHFQDVGRLTLAAQGGDAEARAKLDSVAVWLAKDLRQSEKAGRSVMLYSEENILGFMEDNLARGTLYHDLPARLAAYAPLLPAYPARIGIGLRSYDSLWLSSYAYILMHRNQPGFMTLRDRMVENRRGWVDVLTEIRAAWPGAELVVWRQEDLSGILRDVVARLGGISDPSGLTLPEGPVNPSISTSDIPLVHRLRRTERGMYGDALLDRLASWTGDRGDAFPGFAAADRAAMQARYADDLARLHQMGIDIMQPGSTGQAARP